MRRNTPRHRGLGLAELLIALSISAALLVSVAVAVNASFQAYAVNQEQSRLMQNGRLAMHRIVEQIRRTVEHQPYNSTPLTNFRNGLITTDTGVSLFTESNQELSFRHDGIGKRLLAIDAAGTEHILLRGVQAFQIKFEPMKSQTAIKTGGNYDKLYRATIELTIASEGNSPDLDDTVAAQTVTLSGSVVPRRNVW